MLKTIIFDLKDVLITDACRVYRRKYVYQLPKSKQMLCHNAFHLNDLGKNNLQQLCQYLHQQVTPQLSAVKIKELITSAKLIKPNWKLANKLAGRYQVIILTNADKNEASTVYKNLKIKLKKFPFVCSGRLGMCKPNKSIYQYTLKRYKVDPKQALYIDDRKINLMPAKRFGMITYLYDQNYPKLLKFLKKSGIKIN